MTNKYPLFTDLARTGFKKYPIKRIGPGIDGGQAACILYATSGRLGHEEPWLTSYDPDQVVPREEVPVQWRVVEGGANLGCRYWYQWAYAINDLTSASREAIVEWLDDLHNRGIIDLRHIEDREADLPVPRFIPSKPLGEVETSRESVTR